MSTLTDAPTSLVPSGRTEEEIDPELLELPDPPKRERTLTVAMLVFTAFASIAMVFALRRDAVYAFAPAAAEEVNDLSSAPASVFAENRFVHASGMLGAAHAIKYERPLMSDSFRLMPVAGNPHAWVEVRVPAGAENVRYVPPSTFTGRFVRFDGGGPKHRGLASAVKDATGQEIPAASWILVEGDQPAGSRWAVLLCAMFVGFATWNLLVIAKLVKKVR